MKYNTIQQGNEINQCVYNAIFQENKQTNKHIYQFDDQLTQLICNQVEVEVEANCTYIWQWQLQEAEV